jgi:2-amino-4-hydroxy-6-hydroxymethyldihydropteridine diphosphokinase
VAQRSAAFVGLGSNLDDPVAQVRRAVAELDTLRGCALTAISPLFRSAPMGPPGQGWYVNAVAALDVDLGPRELLACLQSIEDSHGRDRSAPRWGARTLDLDLLLYGELEMDEAGLQIPHPGLTSRNFVVYPLLFVAPDLVLPNGRSLAQVASSLDWKDLERMEDE